MAIAFLVAFFLPPSLAGQDLNISQIVHTGWTARDGAPQAINALAQAPDGTLWIGSDGGLFNFDGLTFHPFQPIPGEPQLSSTAVKSVCVSRDGTVWAGLFLGGVARIANGHVTIFTKADDVVLHVVFKLRQAPDGSMWAINDSHDLIRFGDDRLWHKEELPSRIQIRGSTISSLIPPIRCVCREEEYSIGALSVKRITRRRRSPWIC
jgi:ligand-binding sensor domain-containing protein